jgi:hypothetical protein
MGPPATLGVAVTGRAVRVAILASLWCGPSADAAERYALIVTGASGGEEYARKYEGWRASLATVLSERLGYPRDHLIVLAEQDAPGVRRATRENVRAAVAEIGGRATADDLVLVVLIGHGTAFDGEDAKLNLVGPDLSAEEWNRLLAGVKGRLVFVGTMGASFPFLQKIAARGRIVIAATDSLAQRFDTVFPEFFVRALTAAAADLDKNGRISVWEAFAHASAGTRQWFEERGQLATERPVLDDDGDGEGAEAGSAAGRDGALARATYFQADEVGATGDGRLAALLRERASIEAKIEALRSSKADLPPDRYDQALEALLLDLARVTRQIREREKP